MAPHLPDCMICGSPEISISDQQNEKRCFICLFSSYHLIKLLFGDMNINNLFHGFSVIDMYCCIGDSRSVVAFHYHVMALNFL